MIRSKFRRSSPIEKLIKFLLFTIFLNLHYFLRISTHILIELKMFLLSLRFPGPLPEFNVLKMEGCDVINRHDKRPSFVRLATTEGTVV